MFTIVISLRNDFEIFYFLNYVLLNIPRHFYVLGSFANNTVIKWDCKSNVKKIKLNFCRKIINKKQHLTTSAIIKGACNRQRKSGKGSLLAEKEDTKHIYYCIFMVYYFEITHLCISYAVHLHFFFFVWKGIRLAVLIVYNSLLLLLFSLTVSFM